MRLYIYKWADEVIESRYISNPFNTEIVLSISSAETSKCVTNRMAVGPKEEQRISLSFNVRIIEFFISSEATSIIIIMLVTSGVTFFTQSH